MQTVEKHFLIDHTLDWPRILRMGKLFILFFYLILASGELYAWDKESEVIKSKDGSICRVYKDWILKFDLKVTLEEPEGGPGSQIALIKRTAENPQISCDSSKSALKIESGGQIFVGYSEGFLYLERYKCAPGSESIKIFDARSGKEKMNIFTSGKAVEVEGTKIIFWEGQKHLKGSECKGKETVPGSGCILIKKTELEIKSGKKRLLGEMEIIPI